jgi:AcrR family transcriptional regulator
MPKLWADTIDTHREQVRDAITATTAGLVAREGLGAVTMSRVAAEVGIGRATLYKYFPSVEAILLDGHARRVAAHLDELEAVRRGAASPADALEDVLRAHVRVRRDAHGPDLGALLRHADATEAGHRRLAHLLEDVLADAVAAGAARDDVPPAELAAFCLAALDAAAGGSRAAADRLVGLVLAAVRPSGRR